MPDSSRATDSTFSSPTQRIGQLGCHRDRPHPDPADTEFSDRAGAGVQGRRGPQGRPGRRRPRRLRGVGGRRGRRRRLPLSQHAVGGHGQDAAAIGGRCGARLDGLARRRIIGRWCRPWLTLPTMPTVVPSQTTSMVVTEPTPRTLSTTPKPATARTSLPPETRGSDPIVKSRTTANVGRPVEKAGVRAWGRRLRVRS